MADFSQETNKDEISKEYGSLISSLLLCNHFNPEDNAALRKTARHVRRRVKSTYVKDICRQILMSKQVSPLRWLEHRIEEIETIAPVIQFLRYTRQAESVIQN